MEITNLCYVLKDGKVLLIHKKRGLGAGKINAPGGKVEQGETAEAAVVRELKEEIGAKPVGLEFRGLLEFVNNRTINSLCYVFVANGLDNEPVETDEAAPAWFDVQDLPYEQMWEDDRLWLGHVLSGKTVLARFEFKDWKMVSHRVMLVQEKI